MKDLPLSALIGLPTPTVPGRAQFDAPEDLRHQIRMLEARSYILQQLEEAGVDNWEGYPL